jgi:hypothetical protein
VHRSDRQFSSELPAAHADSPDERAAFREEPDADGVYIAAIAASLS